MFIYKVFKFTLIAVVCVSCITLLKIDKGDGYLPFMLDILAITAFWNCAIQANKSWFKKSEFLEKRENEYIYNATILDKNGELIERKKMLVKELARVGDLHYYKQHTLRIQSVLVDSVILKTIN